MDGEVGQPQVCTHSAGLSLLFMSEHRCHDDVRQGYLSNNTADNSKPRAHSCLCLFHMEYRSEMDPLLLPGCVTQ